MRRVTKIAPALPAHQNYPTERPAPALARGVEFATAAEQDDACASLCHVVAACDNSPLGLLAQHALQVDMSCYDFVQLVQLRGTAHVDAANTLAALLLNARLECLR